MECLGYSGLNKNERLRINEFIDICEVQNINDKIKQKTIDIRCNYKFKLFDSIIMATASAINVPIITADNDFRKIGYEKLILYEK